MISEDPVFAQVKFFVLTAPSWRERTDENNKPPLERINLRNNAVIAAVVSSIREILQKFRNVFFLDYYAMSISRSDEMVDEYHYIISEVKENNVSVTGSIGITAAKVLLEEMCAQASSAPVKVTA